MYFRVAAFAGLIVGVLWGSPAQGQRIHIPPATLAPTTAPAASVPPTLNATPAAGAMPASGATLGAPTFDPYAIAPTAPPGYAPPVAPSYAGVPQYGTPQFGAPQYGAPQYGAPPITPQYQAPAFGAPQFGQPPLYSQPYALPPASPGGVWSGDVGRVDPYQQGEALRLFQNVRFRHTWLSRLGDEDGLGIHDSEVATTAAFPRFLLTTQPLYVSPGFILHLWDGPGGLTADLPPRAYTGYVDFDYTTNPQYAFGGDLHARLGLYSDFEAFNTRSFRVSGRGLGTYRFSPELQAKFGVEYINRNDLKLLPAGGLLWTPNPQVRFDIYFPKPKLAMYVTTFGNCEVWGYLAGEYGGGAWTIEREAGGSDRIDINDLRVILGTEFMTGASFKGFFEGGFVFSREVVYVGAPEDNFSPGETFMLRGGIAY